MKYALQKDRVRRRIFFQSELCSIKFRCLLRSEFISDSFRIRLYPSWWARLGGLPGRIRNRCSVTGRAGSPLRDFHLSRMTFRQLANSGQVVGVRRSSWLFLRSYEICF